MKQNIYLLIVFMVIALDIAFAQDQILFKDKGTLFILDIEKNQILELDTIYNLSLSGYVIKQDNLNVYLRDEDGVITKRSYKTEFYYPNKKSIVTVNNIGANYRPKRDYFKTIYSSGRVVLHNNLGEHLICYVDEKLLWNKSRISFMPGPFVRLEYGYQLPRFSSTNEHILFDLVCNPIGRADKKKKLIEINIKTGKKDRIAKNVGFASYSSDGSMILFENLKTKKYGIWYRNENKTKWYSWESAFWLFMQEQE